MHFHELTVDLVNQLMTKKHGRKKTAKGEKRHKNKTGRRKATSKKKKKKTKEIMTKDEKEQ